MSREVTFEEGKKFSLLHKAEYFEISALSGQNVDEAFTEIGKRRVFEKQEAETVDKIDTKKEKKEGKDSCCM